MTRPAPIDAPSSPAEERIVELETRLSQAHGLLRECADPDFSDPDAEDLIARIAEFLKGTRP